MRVNLAHTSRVHAMWRAAYDVAVCVRCDCLHAMWLAGWLAALAGFGTSSAVACCQFVPSSCAPGSSCCARCFRRMVTLSWRTAGSTLRLFVQGTVRTSTHAPPLAPGHSCWGNPSCPPVTVHAYGVVHVCVWCCARGCVAVSTVSVSCPNVRTEVYLPETIDAQLTAQMTVSCR